MLGIAVGALVALGVVWYATSNRTTSVVDAPGFERSVPDSTTGQSPTNMPGRDRPSPTPPGPTTR